MKRVRPDSGFAQIWQIVCTNSGNSVYSFCGLTSNGTGRGRLLNCVQRGGELAYAILVT